MRRSGAIVLALAALAACTPAIVPQPGGRPSTPPPPSPAPVRPAPQSLDWQDWPLAPGNWTYGREQGSTIARFGASAWVRCDLATRAVAVGRAASSGTPDGAAMMTIRTTFGALAWPAHATTGATRGTEALRGASDPGLDQIAFSRGRFTIELPGNAPLVLPTWAEPARVVEDCRG